MLPILFKIGDFEVHSFGVVLIIAFIAAYFYGRARAPKFGLTANQVGDAFFYTLIAGVLGARIGFIVQELPHYLEHPDQLLSLKFQGLTSFGGLIGGMIALLFLAKRAGVPARSYLDLAGAPLLVGHAIGRVGCLLNGCCYGRRCDLPWATPVEHVDGLFHPAQIYDSLMVVAGLFLLMSLEKRGLRPGQSAALAAIVYCVSRFIYEFWRAGTPAEVMSGIATSTTIPGLPLTEAQVFSLGAILVAVVAWIVVGRQAARVEPFDEPRPEAP